MLNLDLGPKVLIALSVENSGMSGETGRDCSSSVSVKTPTDAFLLRVGFVSLERFGSPSSSYSRVGGGTRRGGTRCGFGGSGSTSDIASRCLRGRGGAGRWVCAASSSCSLLFLGDIGGWDDIDLPSLDIRLPRSN